MTKKAETENINDKFHLRRQITLLFLLVIVSSTFVINFLSNKMIIKEFNEIAKKSGTENMNLIINILNIEIERLEGAAKDYGAWDNTYDFVEDRNEDYLESNYVDETFENNKWNMFFLLGRDNSVIYSKGYDFYEQEEVIIAENFVKFLKSQAYLFDEEEKESAIVDTPRGKLILVTYPILKSDGEGPSRGWLVCARYLDEYLFEDISHASLVEFQTISNFSVEEPMDAEFVELGKHTSGRIWIDEKNYRSLANVYDSQGRMLFTIDHGINKTLITTGRETVVKYSMYTVIILLATFALLFLFINDKIFNRLKGLIESINNILENNDLSKRVKVSENDEISILENRFNNLISTVEDTQNKIIHQAQHDPLTGTLNRTVFFSKVEEVINAYTDSSNNSAIVFIDLDGFKEINDSLGHHAGDYILKSLSIRLKEMVENYGGSIARFGGDEFVIFIPDIISIDRLTKFCEEMLDLIKQPMVINNKSCQVTCSAGVSLFPDHGTTVDELINNGDIAMYCIKKKNKNNFAFYNEDMRSRISLELMHQALENKEFVLYYQKQVDALSGRMQGVEALVRWIHPELGLIPPMDFISLAEETGFIVPLGNWILETACKQCKIWNEGADSTLKVAVNISSIQFMQRDFIKDVTVVIRETGIKPSNLEFEITESVALYKEEEVIDKIKQLKQLGIRIAIDDFGTGYSSLNYLEKFNIDGLKIDKAFVDNINKSSSVAKSIIALSENLGLTVLAEGVETEEQVKCLLELGCANMQGYYFAKPVPADELI